MISKKRRDWEQNHNLLEHTAPAITGIKGTVQKRKISASVRNETLIPLSPQSEYVYSVFLVLHSVVCWFKYIFNKKQISLSVYTTLLCILLHSQDDKFHPIMLDHQAHKKSTMD